MMAAVRTAGVGTHHFDVREAGEHQRLEQLTSDSARAHAQHLAACPPSAPSAPSNLRLAHDREPRVLQRPPAVRDTRVPHAGREGDGSTGNRGVHRAGESSVI
jgi:hypothetical protein